ncbi:MAG: hypothetical protein NHB32_06440 [Fischerella sp. CENA71]|nr:hypothetical protein [Fischerella sp. CENA71]
MTKFSQIWIVDSSTLEALFCKLKSLEDIPKRQLTVKMGLRSLYDEYVFKWIFV